MQTTSKMTSSAYIRQFTSVFIGSLSVLVAGMTYVWVTPLLSTFKSPTSPVNMTEDQQGWMVNLIEAGDMIATLPVGFLSDRYGRKSLLLWTVPLLCFTWALVLIFRSVYVLYCTRLLQGIAVGTVFTVAPMYLGEVPGTRLRGLAGNLVQIMWYLGLIYVNSVGMITESYIWITVACLVPPIVFLVVFIKCPETPHYLALAGREEQADEVSRWLGVSPVQGQAAPRVRDWFKLLTERRSRRAVVVVTVVAWCNVSGVPAVISYATEALHPLVGDQAQGYTVALCALTLAVSLVSAGLVDVVGRRPLLISSTAASAVCLFLAGGYLAALPSHPHLQEYSHLAALAIVLYPAAMSLGPGSLTYTLQAELFSSARRAAACGLLTLTVALTTFLSLYLYKTLELAFGLHVVFISLGVICVLGTIFIAIAVPETARKTFDEIQELL